MSFLLTSFSARASKIYVTGGILDTHGHSPPQSTARTDKSNRFLYCLYFPSLFNFKRVQENSLPKVPRYTSQLQVTLRMKCMFSTLPNQLNPFFYKWKTHFQSLGWSLLIHGLQCAKLYFHFLKNGGWIGQIKRSVEEKAEQICRENMPLIITFTQTGTLYFKKVICFLHLTVLTIWNLRSNI